MFEYEEGHKTKAEEEGVPTDCYYKPEHEAIVKDKEGKFENIPKKCESDTESTLAKCSRTIVKDAGSGKTVTFTYWVHILYGIPSLHGHVKTTGLKMKASKTEFRVCLEIALSDKKTEWREQQMFVADLTTPGKFEAKLFNKENTNKKDLENTKDNLKAFCSTPKVNDNILGDAETNIWFEKIDVLRSTAEFDFDKSFTPKNENSMNL